MSAAIPALAYTDIERAVSSAIQFGVSAEDFIRFCRQAWSNELRDKAGRDDDAFAPPDCPHGHRRNDCIRCAGYAAFSGPVAAGRAAP